MSSSWVKVDLHVVLDCLALRKMRQIFSRSITAADWGFLIGQGYDPVAGSRILHERVREGWRLTELSDIVWCEP